MLVIKTVDLRPQSTYSFIHSDRDELGNPYTLETALIVIKKLRQARQRGSPFVSGIVNLDWL